MRPKAPPLRLILPFLFSFPACVGLGVVNDVALPVNAGETAVAETSEAAPEPDPSVSSSPSEVTVSAATLRAHELTLRTGQIGRVPLDVTLSNGSSYRKISSALDTPYGLNATVEWDSDDAGVVTAAPDGTLAGIVPGTVEITANVAGATDRLTVTVIGEGTENDANDDASDTPLPEEPVDPSDRFLNANDAITIAFGEDGGFGGTNVPDAVYGPPVSNRADVVSLGLGGEITVELGGYAVVNGDGADFTIFENAFSGWTEPGFVAVSENGTDYVMFPCDATRGYAGCAGLSEVGYSADENDYLNPLISGGDGFDLADAGLAIVRFVKITDVNDCDNPVVCVADKAGFDLDAIAIINGANF